MQDPPLSRDGLSLCVRLYRREEREREPEALFTDTRRIGFFSSSPFIWEGRRRRRRQELLLRSVFDEQERKERQKKRDLLFFPSKTYRDGINISSPPRERRATVGGGVYRKRERERVSRAASPSHQYAKWIIDGWGGDRICQDSDGIVGGGWRIPPFPSTQPPSGRESMKSCAGGLLYRPGDV
jgi:hypothetical protein